MALNIAIYIYCVIVARHWLPRRKLPRLLLPVMLHQFPHRARHLRLQQPQRLGRLPQLLWLVSLH